MTVTQPTTHITQTTATQTNLDMAKLLGRLDRHEDCAGCGWRIVYTPSLKFYTGDTTDGYAIYNHSIIRRVYSSEDGGYTLVVVPWNRKPRDPDLVELLDIDDKEIVSHEHSIAGRAWSHVSPLHPDRAPAGENPKACIYPRPHSRCPKCKSRQIETVQNAWTDDTKCPECGYNYSRSIGD